MFEIAILYHSVAPAGNAAERIPIDAEGSAVISVERPDIGRTAQLRHTGVVVLSSGRV
jgi:hypothetical protein